MPEYTTGDTTEVVVAGSARHRELERRAAEQAPAEPVDADDTEHDDDPGE